MKIKSIGTFLVGVVLFIVLPVLAPPVVLQSSEIPRFLLGLGGGAVMGATLAIWARSWRGIWFGLACPLAGTLLYETLFVAPWYGFGGPGPVLQTFVYLSVPAVLGAVLAVAVLALAARFSRRRGVP